MMYLDFEAGNKVYKLRLNTRNVIALEKQLGKNPMAIFGSDGSQMPTVSEMVAVLWASLQQYQHNITMNDAYDIFDNYLADNHTMIDFFPILFDIYKVSGLIPRDKEENSEKN